MDVDDDLDVLNEKLRESLPFAVVGCEEPLLINGKKILARKNPWGLVEIENEAHCDFSKLRHLLTWYAVRGEEPQRGTVPAEPRA